MYISILYRSLPRRQRHVIKAKRHATKYGMLSEYNVLLIIKLQLGQRQHTSTAYLRVTS